MAPAAWPQCQPAARPSAVGAGPGDSAADSDRGPPDHAEIPAAVHRAAAGAGGTHWQCRVAGSLGLRVESWQGDLFAGFQVGQPPPRPGQPLSDSVPGIPGGRGTGRGIPTWNRIPAGVGFRLIGAGIFNNRAPPFRGPRLQSRAAGVCTVMVVTSHRGGGRRHGRLRVVTQSLTSLSTH